MREIKFRGKTKDGKWVYGYLTTLSDGDTLVIEYKKDGHKHKDLIIPDTLGQYIGIKDIHKKKVFKGDIVKVREIIYTNCSRKEIHTITEFVGEVVWHQYGWQIARKTEDGIAYRSLWLWNVEGEDDSMEILGDRYNNPELLEVAR